MQCFSGGSRMNTEEAKTIYKERASTAEFPNAVCRNRGLYQFRVRGTVKAKAVSAFARIGIQSDENDQYERAAPNNLTIIAAAMMAQRGTSTMRLARMRRPIT